MQPTTIIKSWCFITCLLVFQVTFSQQTKLSLQVINLPNELEGQSIAIAGTVNGWSNSATSSTVTSHTLSYSIDIDTLIALGSEWIDAPAGANTGFRFVKPGTWEDKIRAYFQTNDANFRIALQKGIQNVVLIDAKNEIVPIIDQDKCVEVNGVLTDNSAFNKIDPTRFAFPGGKWKALIMSYDDGGYQDRNLVAIFNSYGIIGSFNINSGLLGNPDKIRADEVATLYGPNEVALHTVSHPHLENETDANLYKQIADCQTTISNLVGYKVTGMAYPFGSYDKRTLVILSNLGILYSRTTINTFSLAIPYDLPNNLLRWNPTCHDSGGDYWANQLINWNKEEMALLHIWGHSWEHSGSWTSLTDLCAKLGRRSDIWYAKAWEVANYFKTITELVPVAGNGYYNPSSTTSVWVKTTTGIKEIKPKQTVTDVVLSSETGAVSNSRAKFQVYPNPSNRELTVAYNKSGTRNKVKISVFDFTGKEIRNLRKELKNSNDQLFTTVDISGLPNGDYVMKVESGRDFYTKQISVKR